MDYYHKYLLYKSKYLTLKNQIGGDDELVNVVWTKSEFLSIFPSDFNYAKLRNPDFNIFKLSFLDKYSSQVLQEINAKLPEVTKSSLFKSPWAAIGNQRIVAALYDSIALFYLSQSPFQEFWNNVQLENGIKIKIFYGETTSLTTTIFKNSSDKFIEGLNILLSCQSDELAHELTVKYHKDGKYFIGFKFFAHVYGSTLIKCQNTFKEQYLQPFLESEEYNKIVGENPPIIKLINVMYDFFKKQCPKCRNCIFIDRESICQKIGSLKKKIIDKKEPFTRREAFFTDDDGIRCNTESFSCKKDELFESYIISKLSAPIIAENYANTEYFRTY